MRVLLLLLLTLATLFASGQTALDAATERLLRDEQLAHATLGIAVVDANTGQLVKSLNASKSLVPASLMKVPTTATALSVLGEDYRFTTQLCYSGRIIDGTLEGDLHIVGGGDPTLGGGRPEGALDLDELLARWVAAVRQAGIRAVSGRVIGNESLDPGAEPSPYWQWNDIGNYYGAGPGALVINENKFALRLQRTANVGGKPKIIGYEPNPGELRWTNKLTSGSPGSGDQSYIFGAPGTYDRVIRGTIPAGKGTYKVKGSLPQPALHAAQWLTEALEQGGIAVGGEAGATSSLLPSSAAVIDTYRSPRLADIAKLTNFRSVNLFAEALYAALGREWNTTDAPSEIGERLVDYWSSIGIATDGWEQVDGSGLSMRNMITPAQLAEVIRRSPAGFRQNLPRVGKEGTVRGLNRGVAGADRVRAKSGTLKRARGFCGYATTSAGRELAFAIVVNNYTGSGRQLRRKMGRWMMGLAE